MHTSAADARSRTRRSVSTLQTIRVTFDGHSAKEIVTAEKCGSAPKGPGEAEKTARENGERFRRALPWKAVGALWGGEQETGKALLRRYVNATVGFKQLGRELGKHERVFMQMLSLAENPRARNLLRMIETLQRIEGLEFGIVVSGRGRAAY